MPTDLPPPHIEVSELPSGLVIACYLPLELRAEGATRRDALATLMRELRDLRAITGRHHLPD